MAYYGVQEPENIRAQIRSTRGETIDLSVPITCTVGDLRGFLIDEYLYAPDTRLVFNGRSVAENGLVNDFPYGSLLISGGNAPATDNGAFQRAAAAGPAAQSRALGGGVPSPNTQQQQFQQRPTYATQQQQATPAAPPTRPKVLSPVATATQPRVQSPVAAPVPARAKVPSPVAVPKAKSSMPPPPPPEPTPAAQPPLTSPTPPANDGAGAPVKTSARASQEAGTPERGSGNRRGSASRNSNGAGKDGGGSGRRASPNRSRGGESGSGDGSGGDKAPWQLATFTIECVVPDLDKTVALQVNGDASVADLVTAVAAALPNVTGGAKVIYRGKILSQSPTSMLFNYGIRADARVYIASGRYISPDTITLLEIENEVNEVEVAVHSPLTELQRKGYYETLMRVLFRTDSLMELEGEWRQRRKDAVAHIKRLQDILHPDHD